MQPETWKKVEELYEAALAEPPEQRADFLSRAGAADPQIAAEVKSLFAQTAESFLEGSPLSSVIRAGVKLGNFEMLERIGRGGMGEVWRARDTRLKRDVAIKLLPPEFGRDPDRIARFEHEARAASALDHPNIVSVFDVGSENGVYWIVSELVQGESLRAVILRGSMPPRKVVEIGAQIAEGLAAAHQAGIVHRDLKPANIMVRRDGGVKIVDFGLAKRLLQSPESATLTDSGTILGTAGYMSPEQVRGEAVDARSDMFSFGVMLYEMLSGKAAFSGTSSIEVMHAILNEEPPELPPSNPAVLSRIIRRCLEKQPDRRFQSASDLGFSLVSSSETAALKPLQKRSRRWWKWMAAGAAAVLALAGTYWLRRSLQPLPSTPAGGFYRLTSDQGLTTNAAISPDGKLVAYASDRADPNNLDIWVQQVDSGRAVRITDDPSDDDEPTFSPDGTQIAFHSDREGGGIYVIPALGGEPRLVVPKGQHPRMSPDGQRLLYFGAGENELNNLFITQLPDGPPTRIGAACDGGGNSAIWSPDSRLVLYMGNCSGGNVLISTPDGKRVRHSNLNSNLIAFDQWLANPSRLLVTSNVFDGASTMTIPISEDGTRVTGPVDRLTFGTDDERSASAASNGRIALSSINSNQRIWGIPIDARGHATGTAGALKAGLSDGFPVLSRDGKKLVFTSSTLERPHPVSGRYLEMATGKEHELFTIGQNPIFSPDGTKIMSLKGMYGVPAPWRLWETSLHDGASKEIWAGPKGKSFSLMDWSPDGSTILFHQDYSNNIEELDLKTLSRTVFLADPPYALWQSHFSNDGRWVTFNAVGEGRSQIFVVPFRKSQVARSEWIPITGGQWDDKPHFSHDGKLIFFTSMRDGYMCIWGQPLGPDKRPVGDPFAVYHAHQRRRSLANIPLGDVELGVGPDMIVFNQAELTGNIWLLNPGKSNPQ